MLGLISIRSCLVTNGPVLITPCGYSESVTAPPIVILAILQIALGFIWFFWVYHMFNRLYFASQSYPTPLLTCFAVCPGYALHYSVRTLHSFVTQGHFCLFYIFSPRLTLFTWAKLKKFGTHHSWWQLVRGLAPGVARWLYSATICDWGL